MEKRDPTPVYIMGVDENGQNVYTDKSDPSKRYIFDEDGNISRYEGPEATSTPVSIKIEAPLHSDESSNDDMLNDHCGIVSLEDASHLEMIHSLDEVAGFEDTLMQQLDSDLMNVETNMGNNGIAQHMDIREPLSKLRELLEQRLGVPLQEYSFTLQGNQHLQSDKNLTDQCVQGEGLVQINVDIETHLKRINILDVLKPAEDYNEEEEEALPSPPQKNNTKENNNKPEPKKHVVQWQVDEAFKKEQERLKIPANPEDWNMLHVRHWLQWAVRQFNLPNLKLTDWSMNGKELFELTLQDFQKLVPNDPGDVFWTHLELLRKIKVVAIMKEEGDIPPSEKRTPKLMKQTKFNRLPVTYTSSTNQYINCLSPVFASRTGNNGQIQLWQFLLELLTCKDYKHIIHWLDKEGEFKLSKPDLVAQLWGERKNKPTMNYEKLSRALRYYYDGDMISKVHGKRFVYKFVCDLKQLLGYSAVELARLVNFGNPRKDDI